MVQASCAAGLPMCTLFFFLFATAVHQMLRHRWVIDFSCNGLLVFASALEVAEKSHVNKLTE